MSCSPPATSLVCHFNGCNNPIVPGTRKCEAHKKKGICGTGDCHNQVYRAGVCVRHGARDATCAVRNCTKKLRVGLVCHRHSTCLPRFKCLFHGCTAVARGTSTCKRHSPDAIYARARGTTAASPPVVAPSDQDASMDEDTMHPIEWSDERSGSPLANDLPWREIRLALESVDKEDATISATRC
ncbi:Aste57867_9380 [Aphanomyces stellatus]|uniref:Aste57867_9380 protein n=1 Tax=Aphanomyces stellatus TaxID=120398 RepID=A0A485KN26_9STRA|nr:hypothetical protein As57867_009344 [Aphanomyces stellatus]VFT86261.1 Aste57867_9380 [Aphanomyces stellatus]